MSESSPAPELPLVFARQPGEKKPVVIAQIERLLGGHQRCQKQTGDMAA
jgi:hypothetical protein